MKNSKLGKVEIRSSRLPITRNNLSRDVHTTASFCDFQPTMVHEMQPDSAFTMNIETGILMGSMVCPTMGRLNFESFGMFVPTTDIFPCYNEFKTGTPYTYGENTFVPLHRPRVPVCLLSLFCLFGARATVYQQQTDVDGKSQSWRCLDSTGTGSLIARIKASYGNGTNTFFDVRSFAGFGGESMHGINPIYIFKSTGLNLSATSWTTWFSNNFVIPIAGSPTSNSLGFLYGKDNNDDNSLSQYGTKFVSIEHPDFQINIPYKILPTSADYDGLACICFKMSDFGRRIYKALRGLGIKPNFNDSSNVDVSPVMAEWKAYYDMFGIKKWSNYQSTSLAKMVSLWQASSCPATLVSTDGARLVFCEFMMDLGRMWFTDEQDFVTAHQANIEDDPTNPISAGGFIDVGSALGSIGTASDVLQAVGTKPVESGFENKHAAINRVLHSQVDSELLRKFYLWTNRNSIIGQDVAELLKAQGHEKWLSEHQSRFIGHHSIRLNIDKVVSQSDTYDSVSGEGALLGEYGGRGLGYDDNSIMSYKTNEHGFFIVLTAVVPNAGFCQGDDLRWRRDTRMQEYQPEFDGVGMEASPKELIFSGDVRQPSLVELGAGDDSRFKWHDKTYGFVPMYSRYKYLQNVMNGEFEFGSSQLDKLCYTLDRLMFPNDAFVNRVETTSEYDEYEMEFGSLDADTLPIAGVMWRYLGRYAWLSNFRRIFAVRGTSDEESVIRWLGSTPYLTEFSVAGPDDFIVHQVQNNKYYAHMLSLEASYETKQDGNSGSFDMKSAKV